MSGIRFGKERICTIPIRQWLDYCCGNLQEEYIALPLIQRGSVWRPDQIIDLWDSLLRGMPVGSFMLNTIPENTLVRLPGQTHSFKLQRETFGLLDGQQRTLAMLAGWPLLREQPAMDRRVWVDFADDPRKEHLFILRVTTENHPFGFRRDDAKARLALSDRRKAIMAYQIVHGQEDGQRIDFRKSMPYAASNSLPMDLAELIARHSVDEEVFSAYTLGELKKIKNYRMVNKPAGDAPNIECIDVWSTLTPSEKDAAEDRVRRFHRALTRLLSGLYVPLILIDMEALEAGSQEGDEDPALAILFKRVGANGTSLSNADYIFSVIKHYCPETHELVNGFCERNEDYNIAALLTPASLVTTTVRLAMTRCLDEKNGPLRDVIDLDKKEFYRLLNGKVSISGGTGKFLDSVFLPMMQGNDALSARSLFDELASLLKFRGKGDIGLPAHALILLKKALLQVLLFWVQALEADKERLEANRRDAIRFILFWSLCVTDVDKASLKSYEFIRKEKGDVSLSALYHVLLSEGVAFRLYPPDALVERIGNVIRIPVDGSDKRPLKGWSRFSPTPNEDSDNSDNSKARNFYRRWWGLGGHIHPLLLWLQRDYVASLLGSPVAGREEDTPYDYDHILPQSHWSGWTGQGNNADRIAAFMPPSDNGYGVVGNGIGNVRVWSSSDNRSDGNSPPSIKLSDDDAYKLSAIDVAHKHLWEGCSSEIGKHRSWSPERAIAFQQAVEERAWGLYKDFYADLELSSWQEDGELTGGKYWALLGRSGASG